MFDPFEGLSNSISRTLIAAKNLFRATSCEAYGNFLTLEILIVWLNAFRFLRKSLQTQHEVPLDKSPMFLNNFFEISI